MRALIVMTLFILFALQGCKAPSEDAMSPGKVATASPKEWADWAQWANRLHPVDDGQGHGPDVASAEWSRALDRQLAITNQSGHGPDVGSDEWRKAVERKLANRSYQPLEATGVPPAPGQ